MKPFLPRISSFHLPNPEGKELIWIHGVSVGEIKAAQPLFRALKEKHPNAFFFVTTTTTTGQFEARRSLNADAVRYLPFDIPWVARLWAERLRPKLFLLIETDFWPNLLRAIRRVGGKTALVSGKLSFRSARRFQRFAPLSKRLFSLLDLLCVQNEEHARRFEPLLVDPSRLHITGNLKLDQEPQPVEISFWQQKLALSRPALAVTCTHSGEEESILEALCDLDLFFFLAPRHPERFDEVAHFLTRKSIPFFRWSKMEKRRGGEKVLLVDAMGQLPICYSLSRLAIVGGSFTGKVGGHNVLEPCLYKIPVFFGPSMDAQREFASKVLASKAGKQIPLDLLRISVEEFFQNESLFDEGVQSLFAKNQGAVQRTLRCLHSGIDLL